MKKRNRKYCRWMILAVLAGVAGCSYSCSAHEPEVILSEEAKESLVAGDGSRQNGDLPVEVLEDGDLPTETFEGTAEEAKEASCFVHVCGEVNDPGVYELFPGQRVYEAISLAGGFTEQAAENYLNLAEPVWDGMKLEVPNRDQAPKAEWTEPEKSWPAAEAFSKGGPGMSASLNKVNLNTATKEELMGLRGIGEARAEDIIRFRQERGGFKQIEDIMEISGIKDAAFQKIKDDITV